MKIFKVVLLAFTLSACASLGLQSQTVDQSLLQAESVATSALVSSTHLYRTHKISLTDDQKVRKAHDEVITAVHAGHRMYINHDSAGAKSQLDLIQIDLEILQAFLTLHK